MPSTQKHSNNGILQEFVGKLPCYEYGLQCELQIQSNMFELRQLFLRGYKSGF